LEKFGFIHHVITFVKDEKNKPKSMATTFSSINDYAPLKKNHVYEGICFGHVIHV
jgi:hypothetical protein